jgi:taurine dioxygenase
MKIKNLSKFGVEVSDLDLSQKLSPDTLKSLHSLTLEHLVVVFRGQTLSTDEQVNLCQEFGNIGRFKGTVKNHISRWCEDGRDGILRVTGRKDSSGQVSGIFSHNSTLDWHSNKPKDIDRLPFVWLYAVSHTQGSRTSWLNCAAAYRDMDNHLKDRLDDINGLYAFLPNTYTEEPIFGSHSTPPVAQKFVRQLSNGNTGIFFPFYQMAGFEGLSKTESMNLIEEIKSHVVNEKYIYHHDWQDGDVVISEQNLTIHKRWACDTSQRLLNRVTFDFSKVSDQDHLVSA